MGNCAKQHMQPSIKNKKQLQHQFSGLKLQQKIKMIGHNVTFKIATFNYGYYDSPFQYTDDDGLGDDFGSFQNLFIEIIKTSFQRRQCLVFPEFPQIDSSDHLQAVLRCIQDYDKQYHRNRYSLLYKQDVGIHNQKFLQDRVQFVDIWKQYMVKAIRQNFLDLTQIQKFAIQILCKYDWAFYFIIILYVYMKDTTQADEMSVKEAYQFFDKIIQSEKSYKYQQFVQDQFKRQKNFINDNHKLALLIKFLQSNKNIDIVFLQNVDHEKLKEVKKRTNLYRFAHMQGINSAILISWEWFAKVCPDDTLKPLNYYNTLHFSVQELSEMKRAFPSNQKIESAGELFKKSLIRESGIVTNRTRQSIEHSLAINPPIIEQIEKAPEPCYLNLKQTDEFESDSYSSNEQSDLESKQQIPNGLDKNSFAFLRRRVSQQLIKAKKQKLTKDALEKLGEFQGLYIQFYDRIILASLELENSNTQIQNNAKVFEIMKFLTNEFPLSEIIMGVDACGPIDEYQDYYVYPGPHNQFSRSHKQKNLLGIEKILKIFDKNLDYNDQQEAQNHNKSHLVSTLPLNNKKTIDILGRVAKQRTQTIPSQHHPFQHFIKLSDASYIRNPVSFKKLTKKNNFELTYAAMQMKNVQ